VPITHKEPSPQQQSTAKTPVTVGLEQLNATLFPNVAWLNQQT